MDALFVTLHTCTIVTQCFTCITNRLFRMIPPSLYFRKLWRRGLSIPPLRKACCVSVCACVAVEGGHYGDEDLGLVPVDTSASTGGPGFGSHKVRIVVGCHVLPACPLSVSRASLTRILWFQFSPLPHYHEAPGSKPTRVTL